MRIFLLSIRLFLFVFFVGAVNLSVLGNITLPKVFGPNMVLQRNKPIAIWGWAKPGEKVVLTFANQSVNAVADQKGDWKIQLKAMPEGGPYTMTIKGENTILLSNILMGDVWVCSGQSNMGWPVKRSDNAENEIKNANYPNIRLFDVDYDYSALPLEDIKHGEWKLCTPSNFPDFSAVAYYYGRNLHDSLQVPIGLISSTAGGTSVEAWTSGPAISKFEHYAPIVEDVKTLNIEKEIAIGDSLVKEWAKSFDLFDMGIKESGKEWYITTPNDNEWFNVEIPQGRVNTPMDNGDGVYWYKKEFDVESINNDKAVLSLSAVNESDQVWLNGKLIGETWFVSGERKYTFPAKHLNKGNNTLIIRVKDTGYRGGLWGESEGYYINRGSQRINLSGNWSVRMGLSQVPPRPATFVQLQTPTVFYNAMIAPLTGFAICGVIWYQGESNTGRAAEYEMLFSNMITSWREEWSTGDFPFYFVQLANMGSQNQEPEDAFWAELQEQQQKTLKLPNTGMAVVNDIGDFDVHPTKKKEVGRRLALIALNNHFNRKDIVFSGPVLKSQTISGDTIELVFDHVGDGLLAKDRYGYLKHFAIAGESGDYVWAQAFIKNDSTVVVSSTQVQNPVSVRYAWATNPYDANLYNSAELPASCFRTDNLPLKSEGYKYNYYRFNSK